MFPSVLAFAHQTGEEDRMSTALEPTGLEPVPHTAAAVLHGAGAPLGGLLNDFAAEIAARGFRVGGLAQETLRDANGRRLSMGLVELDTGRRIPIDQPLGAGATHACTVDSAAVAEASAALRRAVANRADLIVVNKFSHLEMERGGLLAEMLAAMAEGIPLLTSVAPEFLGAFLAATGDRVDLLAPTQAALWRWWGPSQLYRDLILGVGDGVARRVAVGFNWTYVEGPHGAGLAQTPARGQAGCRAILKGGALEGRPLRDLAKLALSWNPFETAVGIAAINAHYNRFGMDGLDENGLDVFGRDGRKLAAVGRFPDIAERLPGVKILETEPREGEYPPQASLQVLAGAEGVLATASTLVNRSLPGLLAQARHARFALIGPGAPLSERLFSYGVAALSGLVVKDCDGMAQAVAEGGATGALKRFGRLITLRHKEGA